MRDVEVAEAFLLGRAWWEVAEPACYRTRSGMARSGNERINF
jgi:hypothetical protein